MPIYTGEADVRPLSGIGSMQSSLGEELGATAGEAFANMPTRQLLDLDELAATKPAGPGDLSVGEATAISGIVPVVSRDVPIADAREQVKQSGLPIKLPEQDTIRQATLDIMLRRGREERERQATLARGPGGFIHGALDVGTSLFVGALDPIGLAAFAIPVIGEARYGKLAADVGSTFLERAPLALAIGAEKGAIGSLALSPLEYQAKTQAGQDFGMADILRNALYSAGTMALLHTGFAEGHRAIFGAPELPAAAPGARPAPGPTAPTPESIISDLPPRAKEDVLRGSVASLIEDKPVQAAEHIAAAAARDPRIAETLTARGEDLRTRLGLTSPEPAPAPEPGAIDNTHDVVSGANSSKDPNGPVYIDRRIPQFSPILKDASGQPANLHKYLAIHERTEAEAMARGMSYARAHTDVATPAERAAVEADGVSWKAYSEEIDGYLEHIEHEKVSNPPPDTHVDPEAAIGHHHSSNKNAAAKSETPAPAAAPAGEYREVKSGGATFVLTPRQAEADAAWRALTEAKASHEEPDAIAASKAAELAPEPESIQEVGAEVTRLPARPLRKPRAGAIRGFASLVAEHEKSGMIENAEAYAEAALRRREKTAGQGGGKVYISHAAEARARGMSVKAVNAEHAALEAAEGKRFDEGMAAEDIKPDEISRQAREVAIEAMVRLGMEPHEALDYAMLKLEREAQRLESEESQLAAEGIIGLEEGHGASVPNIPPETGEPPARAGAEGRGEGPQGAGAVREPAREAGGGPREAERGEGRQATALERAADEAEAEFNAIEPYLTDEERALFNEALEKLDQETFDREEMIRRGAACLSMAGA